MKQISVTIPERLYNESKKYCEEFGFKNIQEFMLDCVREKVFLKNLPRYERILADMKKGKNVKTFTQKEAREYIKNL